MRDNHKTPEMECQMDIFIVVGTITLSKQQELFNQDWLLTRIMMVAQGGNQAQRAWPKNFELAYIIGFNNLCVKH
jgi:hypothetical protein